MTDWIQVFIEDRISMTKMMRENTASDLRAGYSFAQITRQMIAIEEYEKETKHLTEVFTEHWNGNKKAYDYLKKVGAIA
jgi:hypothetical protein